LFNDTNKKRRKGIATMENSDLFFRPFSPLTDSILCLDENPDPDFPIPYKTGGMFHSTIQWLFDHPQTDLPIRLRTAYLLRFHREQFLLGHSETEVAAALIADLPKETDFSGLNELVVQTALDFTAHYELEDIAKENTKIPCLIYRLYRCIAEFDCALDLMWHDYELRPDRYANYERWMTIIRLLHKKRNFEVGVIDNFVMRLYWARYRLEITRNDSVQVFSVTGAAEDIDEFSKKICPYFLLDKKRIDSNTLLIGNKSFMPPVVTRIMDGLANEFRDKLKFSVLKDYEVELESFEKTLDANSYDISNWEYYLREFIANSKVVSPVHTLLDGFKRCSTKNEAEEFLMDLSDNPLNSNPFNEPFLTEEEEERKDQEEQKYYRDHLPEDPIFNDTYFAERPDDPLYNLRFHIFTDEKDVPFCSIEEIPGRQEIIQWIQENVPEVKVKPLVFRDEDFELSGYCGEICIVGNNEELKKFIEKFNAKWTDGHGNSIDPRFHLEDQNENHKSWLSLWEKYRKDSNCTIE